ncbi:hypothetical protein QQP08_004238 [Theobroma cacao]|nr:hypothetical protein QQP08_004238 [Theobroma cacao]
MLLPVTLDLLQRSEKGRIRVTGNIILPNGNFLALSSFNLRLHFGLERRGCPGSLQKNGRVTETDKEEEPHNVENGQSMIEDMLKKSVITVDDFTHPLHQK